MNITGKGDSRLPMEKINRGNIVGFNRYFSKRQDYFYDLFNCKFSPTTALEEFNKIGETLLGFLRGAKEKEICQTLVKNIRT
jgi:hypothetical protein